MVRGAGGESNVFLMHQSFISLALLIATTLVAGFFAYIHRIKRQTYLLLWTAAWAVFAPPLRGGRHSLHGRRRTRCRVR